MISIELNEIQNGWLLIVKIPSHEHRTFLSGEPMYFLTMDAAFDWLKQNVRDGYYKDNGRA